MKLNSKEVVMRLINMTEYVLEGKSDAFFVQKLGIPPDLVPVLRSEMKKFFESEKQKVLRGEKTYINWKNVAIALGIGVIVFDALRKFFWVKDALWEGKEKSGEYRGYEKL